MVIHMRVTTAEFIKRWDTFADRALSEPVTITKNGRDRLVMLSVEEYERLKSRDRWVVRVEDVTDEDAELIAGAEVPAEHDHLDTLLDDKRS